MARSCIAELAAVFGVGNGQQTLPGLPAPVKSLEDGHKIAVGRLFSYWQQKCEHPNAKPTAERMRAIIARLREGYAEVEIRKAIDGAAAAAYVSEENGQKYDDLTLICRSGSKLESFISRGVLATGDVVIETTDASPVEEQIAALRRKMSELKKDGRGHEYEQAAAELAALMTQRKERKSA